MSDDGDGPRTPDTDQPEESTPQSDELTVETDESGDQSGESTGQPSESTDQPGEPASSGSAASHSPSGPRKLHPLTVPYRLAQQGVGIVVFLFFVGVPGFTAIFGGSGGLAAIGGVVLLAGGIVGYFVAYYQRFEYELTDDTFDIQSGVFSRREREIPLRRIQNVDISQSVIQRMLGIANVGLETAGGGDTEAQLQYVGESEAKRLQGEVSRLRRSGPDATPEETAEPAETVFEITEKELGVLAVVSTDFRVVSLLFFGGSVFGIPALSADDAPVFGGPENILGALFGPIAGLAAVVVIGLVAGVFNAARYYGFTLSRGEEELRYERGLFQRYSGTIPIPKVQTLTIRENVIARTLGYAALNIETAGHTVSSGESGGSQSAIPLADRGRVHELARSIEPANLDSFERPPKRARQRYAARYSIALLGLAGLLYLGSLSFEFLSYWYVVLAGFLVVPVAAHLKWANRGFAVGGDHVVTRNGFWSRRTKVVPYHRAQTTVSSETIFQRRRDLGTVVVDTAGSRSFGGDDAKAVDVDVATADEIRETVPDRLYEALAARKRERSRDRLEQLERDVGGPDSDPMAD